MRWIEGNRLDAMYEPDKTSSTIIGFEYDLNGMRASKSTNYDFHWYIYDGDRLVKDYYWADGGNTYNLYFFYDNAGRPYALKYNGTTYYYITNLQGDVMGMVDSSGASVASYTYDPYGKVLTATGSMANINPLRYRGYYYDTETGFYYLQSRYYDPATCRFINADSYVSTGQSFIGYNMFAYCNNNPIGMVDPSGVLSCTATMKVFDGGSSPKAVENVYEQIHGLVNGQSAQVYSQDSFGLSTYSKAGCAVIATYNAMQLIDQPMSLGMVGFEYLCNYGTLVCGLFGVAPWNIGSFLRGHDIKYTAFYSEKQLMSIVKEEDVIIYTIMNSTTNILGGFHTMAAQYQNGGFIVYNRYNEYTDSWPYSLLSESWKGGALISGFVISLEN